MATQDMWWPWMFSLPLFYHFRQCVTHRYPSQSTPFPCLVLGIPGVVLKFGFGRDVLLRKLKVVPYNLQFFKKKWPIHIPISPILHQILSKITGFFQNFLWFEPILAQIWENYEKLTHSYTNFAYFKVLIHAKRLILVPMFASHPCRIFCTESSPPPSFEPSF